MPKIIDKESKKIEIITAAIKTFARQGYKNTKMADVAVAANIGKGTLYEYFSSKEDMFRFAFTHFMESMENSMALSMFKQTDPVEKLRSLGKAWSDILKAHEPGIIDIMMDFWAEAIRKKDDDGMKLINLEKIYEDYRKIVKSILDDGVRMGTFKKIDTLLTAAIFISTFDGLIVQWIMDKSAFDVHEALLNATDILIDGILCK